MRHWRRTWRDVVGVRLAYLAGGIAVLGMWSEHVAVGVADWRSWLPDAAVGLALLASGVAAHGRAPRVGVLLIATSVAWWLGNVVPDAVFLHRGLLLIAIWTYPEARIGARSSVLAGVAGGLVSIPGLARSDAGMVWFAVLVLIGGVVRFAVSPRGRRRFRRVALQAATVVALGAVGAAVLRHGAGRLVGADMAVIWYQVTIAASGVMLALGVLRQPTAGIVNAVVELAADRRTPGLDRLAEVLDDPDIVVARRVAGEWIDDRGMPVADSRGGSRVVTVLPGDRVALVHDAAISRDPALLEALESVTHLVSRNAELQVAMERVLDDLVASGRRLRDAEREERERLWTRLHAGVGRRLDVVGVHLATAAASVRDPNVADAIRRATDQLERTRSDLLLISHGLHPDGHPELIDSLASLVADSPVPAEFRAPKQGTAGLGPAISEALSYCCSEALSNAVKHAHADRIVVELSIDESNVMLTVADDGVGGADPARGSGLSGLRDRVRALGGTLRVDSARASGTRLTIALPHGPALLAASEVPP